MKKLSLFLAVLFAVFALFPLSALAAADGPLDIDAAAWANPDRPNETGDQNQYTYAGGFMPTAKKLADGSYSITVRLPLVKNDKVTSDITVKPVISPDFPCIPSNIISTISRAASEWSAQFTFTLKDTTYNGTYPLQLQCDYKYQEAPASNLESLSQIFTVYFTVTGKPVPVEKTPSPANPVPVPRVMLSRYTISEPEVLAGNEFGLTLEITNQSSSQYAQNVKVTVRSDDGAILPAEGTNTAYFSRINAGKTVEANFRFRVNADAPPKPATLSVEIAYENKQLTPAQEGASISVPVAQPIRLKIDEPQVYGSYSGQPVSIYFNVYNMGKSTLYNLLAELQCEGLTAEGSYYGGNLESGGTKTIELTAMETAYYSGGASDLPGYDIGIPKPIPGGAYRFDVKGVMITEEEQKLADEKAALDSDAVREPAILPMPPVDRPVDLGTDGPSKPEEPVGGGEYSGFVNLSYEDSSGRVYTEAVPFTVYLMPQPTYPTGPEYPQEPAVPQSADLTWLYITIPAVVVVALVVILIVRSRRRKRIIENELA